MGFGGAGPGSVRVTAELQHAVASQRPSASVRPRRPFEMWKWVSISVWVLLVLWSIWGLDIKWSRLLDAPRDMYRLFELMFTQLERSDLSRCVRAMWDSIAMAWLGTLFASLVAVPLGFLAAENVVSRWVSLLLRQVFNVLRAVPELILALALIPVLGLTQTAGIMAIAIGSVGTLGKLCSEIVEGVDRGPIEAADSVGASQLQRLRWAVVPQTMPEIASFVLYRFEINIRVSSVLGVLGIGGIGQLLNDGLEFREYGLAGMALIVVVVTTMLIDAISGAVRRRIVAGPSGAPVPSEEPATVAELLI
jgi:phosphonate transport system permease protein